MTKFNVCIIASQAIGESMGGVENFVTHLSSWLNSESIRTMVICSSRKRIAKNVTVESFSQFSPLRRMWCDLKTNYFPPLVSSFAFSLFSFLMIIRFHKKYGFSILHAQDTCYAGLAAVTASKLLGVPVILHSHGIELKSAMLMLRSKRLNATLFSSIYLTSYFLLERTLIKRCNSMIVVSQEAKDYLSGLGIPTENCSVVKVGVDSGRFGRSLDIGHNHRIIGDAKKQGITFGFVGRLVIVKNLDRLFRAFAIAKNDYSLKMRLMIIGDGPLRQNLEEEAKKLGISSDVTFLGERLDVHSLLNEIDVFVLPSLVEGSPTSLLEAMVAGKAVIASDIPSIREIITNGKEGILVNPYDIESLKQAILISLENPNLLLTMGYNAKIKAKSYDFDRTYGKILELYKHTIPARGT